MLRKYKLWIDVPIAVASVILGIIISPIFERLVDPLFSSETRASLTTVLALGLVIVAGIAAIGAYMRRSETRDEGLALSIQDIRNKLGLSAQLVTDLPRTEGMGEVYRKASEIYAQAEKEIWILWHRNLYPFTRRSEEEIRSEEWKKEKDFYYETLFRKCSEHRQGSFFYRRILQIPDAAKVREGTVNSKSLSPEMASHCKELLKYIQQNPEVAVLKYASVFIPQTIALVDERYVLWEIDAVDPDTQSAYMDAVLIFDDADGRLVQYLKNFFLKVDAHSYMVKQITE